MRNNLLINEPPLQVLPSLAQKIGLGEAIVLQQVHYWLHPKFQTQDKCFEGRAWVYNTYEGWQSQFPFWGEKTIRRVIGSLEERGLLLSFVKTGFQKVKYYTIDYDRLQDFEDESMPQSRKNNDIAPSGQNDQIDTPKRADGQKSGGVPSSSQASVSPYKGNNSNSLKNSEKNDARSLEVNTGSVLSFSASSSKVSDQETQEAFCAPIKTAQTEENDVQKDPVLLKNKHIAPSGQNDQIDLVRMTGSLTKNTNLKLKKTNSPFPSQNQSLDQGDGSQEPEHERKMLDIFSKVVLDGRPLVLLPHRKADLRCVLEDLLGGDLTLWERLCINVTRSKFLMGEAASSSFKAGLDWILSGNNAAKILEGVSYGIGDRAGRALDPETPVLAKKESALRTLLERLEGEISDPVWLTCVTHFIKRRGGSAYHEWLEDVRLVLDADTPYLVCETEEHAAALKDHFEHDMRAALWEALPSLNAFLTTYISVPEFNALVAADSSFGCNTRKRLGDDLPVTSPNPTFPERTTSLLSLELSATEMRSTAPFLKQEDARVSFEERSQA